MPAREMRHHKRTSTMDRKRGATLTRAENLPRHPHPKGGSSRYKRSGEGRLKTPPRSQHPCCDREHVCASAAQDVRSRHNWVGRPLSEMRNRCLGERDLPMRLMRDRVRSLHMREWSDRYKVLDLKPAYRVFEHNSREWLLPLNGFGLALWVWGSILEDK